jgi:hypothetical protein
MVIKFFLFYFLISNANNIISWIAKYILKVFIRVLASIEEGNLDIIDILKGVENRICAFANELLLLMIK